MRRMTSIVTRRPQSCYVIYKELRWKTCQKLQLIPLTQQRDENYKIEGHLQVVKVVVMEDHHLVVKVAVKMEKVAKKDKAV